MRRFLFNIALPVQIILVTMSGIVPAHAADSAFTPLRIADSLTPDPATGAPLGDLDAPVLWQGKAAFLSSGKGAVQLWDGSLGRIVGAGAAIPGCDGTFASFQDDLALGSRGVLFMGRDDDVSCDGVYLAANGAIETIVDTAVRVPDSPPYYVDSEDYFEKFKEVDMEGDFIAFVENSGPHAAGVWKYSDGELIQIIAMYGYGGCMAEVSQMDYSHRNLLIKDGALAIAGRTTYGVSGIYSLIGCEATTILEGDDGNCIPGMLECNGRDLIRSFDRDGEHAMIMLHSLFFPGNGYGVYETIIGSNYAEPRLIIGTAMQDFGVLAAIGSFVYDEGVLAFLAETDTTSGLFLLRGGVVEKVLAVGDMLDGRPVARLEMAHAEAMDDGRIAILAGFDTEPAEAVYLLSPASGRHLACEGFLPPLDVATTVHGAGTLFARARLIDESGKPVGEDGVAAPRVRVTYLPGAEAAEDVTIQVAPRGHGEDDAFEYGGGVWRYMLRAGALERSGRYAVELISGDAAGYDVFPGCRAEFVLR